MHALRDLPRAMQLWLNKLPENIKLDFFSLELAKWIDLNLSMSSKWTSYWEVDCHSLWSWRNNEMHGDNYERPLFSGIHVQCRTDKYDEAMKNNEIISSKEKLIIMVGRKPLEGDWVKLNTDGACFIGSSLGCGGII